VKLYHELSRMPVLRGSSGTCAAVGERRFQGRVQLLESPPKPPQGLNSLLKNSFRGSSKPAAAEAETDSGAFTVSLKRYPDTNREFFSKL
jgi:hypothetical protein